MIDSYKDGVRGGTGMTFEWHLAVVAKTFGKVILAGGLTPENVAEAVKLVQPYGVDVTGGVEKEKGNKDHTELRKFITEAEQEHRPLAWVYRIVSDLTAALELPLFLAFALPARQEWQTCKSSRQ